MIGFLAARAIPGVERVTPTTLRAHASRSDGVLGVVTVAPGAATPCVAARSAFPKLAALPAIIARVRRVFDLAADPLAIAAHLARTRRWRRWSPRGPGLRAPGAWDGFELAVRAILGQQITVAAGAGLAGQAGRGLWRARCRDGSALDGPDPRLSDARALVGARHRRARHARAPRRGAGRRWPRAVAADPAIFGAARATWTRRSRS